MDDPESFPSLLSVYTFTFWPFSPPTLVVIYSIYIINFLQPQFNAPVSIPVHCKSPYYQIILCASYLWRFVLNWPFSRGVLLLEVLGWKRCTFLPVNQGGVRLTPALSAANLVSIIDDWMYSQIFLIIFPFECLVTTVQPTTSQSSVLGFIKVSPASRWNGDLSIFVL